MFATYLLVMVIGLGVCLAIALTRRGKVTSIAFGSRVAQIDTPLGPDAVFARLANGVSEFTLEDSDASTHTLLLSTTLTFATWGFFYPITIAPNPSGGSTVRIGIRSKVFQWGPLVTKWHRKCQTEIEGALGGELPAARVV